MKILIIIGENINSNSSTNIFNRQIINYLSKSNEIFVIMAGCNQTYEKNNITFVEYKNDFLIEKLFNRRKKKYNQSNESNLKKQKNAFFNIIKKVYKFLFNRYVKFFYPIYRYNSIWLRRSKKYKSEDTFDLLISISHPPASHKLAYELIKKNNIRVIKWIQIWYENWFKIPSIPIKTKKIQKEEDKLLKNADKIFYSNLYFMNKQKSIFSKYSLKMYYFDLPMEKTNLNKKTSKIEIGYYGTYNSNVRDIIPLYEALKKINKKSYIVGESNVYLKSTRNINIINEKKSLEYCSIHEFNTEILIVITNKYNDSLPGKIYNYSLSNKPILIILDGNIEIKNFIREYFGKYDKYYFCNNYCDEIVCELNKIRNDIDQGKKFPEILDFNTENVIKKILNQKE